VRLLAVSNGDLLPDVVSSFTVLGATSALLVCSFRKQGNRKKRGRQQVSVFKNASGSKNSITREIEVSKTEGRRPLELIAAVAQDEI
jgi:hypothetical protein